jgi:hypothetical protein
MSIPFLDGTRRWQFQFDSDGEISFILRVIRCLQNITAGRFSSSVENFVRECECHSSSIYDNRMLLPMRQTGTFTNKTLDTTPALQSFRPNIGPKTNGSATPDTKAFMNTTTSPPKDAFGIYEKEPRIIKMPNFHDPLLKNSAVAFRSSLQKYARMAYDSSLRYVEVEWTFCFPK